MSYQINIAESTIFPIKETAKSPQLKTSELWYIIKDEYGMDVEDGVSDVVVGKRRF